MAVMELLDYLKQAVAPAERAADIRITVVTNITDDLFQKILRGVCRTEQIEADIQAIPFKQYHVAFKHQGHALTAHQPDITFVLFDLQPGSASEFIADPAHGVDVLNDLDRYAANTQGLVVVQTLPLPLHSVYGNLYEHDPLVQVVHAYNEGLRALAATRVNIQLINTDRLIARLGENAARDLRGQYAFEQPFSHAFVLAVCREWLALIRARLGRTRKCLVLDLDNTLWGGVLGELGPLGIVLGPDYPGSAYMAFQRTLLEYQRRGILLAMNSRNNLSDVEEVFAMNPHMVLHLEQFSAIAANWNSKAENLLNIARELNIGTDTMVFLDDDPMNRDEVRQALPDVLVPDFSVPPESYAAIVRSLDAFHQLQLTEEDRARGQMYADERRRRALQTTIPDPQAYIASLGIVLQVHQNNHALIPRAAQLTQKTNQFNLTTRRYTDEEMRRILANGSMVVMGDVKDKFGSYGMTLLAILHLRHLNADLDTLLMSCRVMGRHVEEAFFRSILTLLHAQGIRTLTGTFCATAKNMPSADFLPSMGAQEIAGHDRGERRYMISVDEYLKRPDVTEHFAITVIPPTL
jgi:FkbH-like protein